MKLQFGSWDPLKMRFNLRFWRNNFFMLLIQHSVLLRFTLHCQHQAFPSTHGKQLLTTNNTKGSHPPANSQQLLPSSPWSATTATTYVIAEPTPPSTKPDLSKPWQNLLQQLLHADLLLFASCSSWSQPPKLLIEPI